MITYKRGALVILIITAVLILSGCGKSDLPNVTTGHGGLASSGDTSEELEESQDSQELFCIVRINRNSKKITVEKVQGSSRQYTYQVTGATYILDKYGNPTTIKNMKVGDVVELQIANDQSKLATIQKSDQVWVYQDVTQFSFDQNRGVFCIGSVNYEVEDSLLVFAGGERSSLSQLTAADTLQVTGQDKKIMTIRVTKGHGTVLLTHTEEFVGGYGTIGNVTAFQIDEKTSISVPAGSYLLTVAYGGYGGNENIRVKAGQITKVNLSQLVSTQVKTGILTFQMVQEGTTLWVNGEKVDTSKPMTLKYGTYQLKATGDQYDTWNRILVFSSEKANLVVDLSDSTEDSTTSSDSSTSSNSSSSENLAGSEAGSLAGSTNSATSGTTSNTTSGTSGSSTGTSTDTSGITTNVGTDTSSLINEVFDALSGGSD